MAYAPSFLWSGSSDQHPGSLSVDGNKRGDWLEFQGESNSKSRPRANYKQVKDKIYKPTIKEEIHFFSSFPQLKDLTSWLLRPPCPSPCIKRSSHLTCGSLRALSFPGPSSWPSVFSSWTFVLSVTFLPPVWKDQTPPSPPRPRPSKKNVNMPKQKFRHRRGLGEVRK